MLFLRLFFILSLSLLMADDKFYTIALCQTKDKDGSSKFLNRYVDTPEADIFVIKLSDNTYLTTYGSFSSYERAKEFMYKLSPSLLGESIYIKEFDYNLRYSSSKNIYKILHKEHQLNYTISVCSSKEYKNALNCIDEYILNPSKDIFIIKDSDGLYKTLYGAFSSFEEASKFNRSLDEQVKKQGPFVKKLSFGLNDPHSYIEVIRKFSGLDTNNIINSQSLILDINSKTNRLKLYSKTNGVKTELKEYIVSTARAGVKKPLGEGGVTSISLEPQWYPTQETIEYFKKAKKIDLPPVVPYKHPLNYMGLAKINLSHEVDSKSVYRIHGTQNESTIGSNESGGCIRMKNSEVVELAKLLQNYASKHGMKNIVVNIN